MSAREGAFDVPEQFAFKKRLRNGAAIHGNKRVCGPWAVVMDCTGDQFFPGPALPLNQDCRSTAGYLADDLKYLDHIAALSDKGRCARSLAEHVLQMTMVADETTMFDGPMGHENQFVEVHRLRDVVEGAFLH